jgi:hypothetical protein
MTNEANRSERTNESDPRQRGGGHRGRGEEMGKEMEKGRNNNCKWSVWTGREGERKEGRRRSREKRRAAEKRNETKRIAPQKHKNTKN